MTAFQAKELQNLIDNYARLCVCTQGTDYEAQKRYEAIGRMIAEIVASDSSHCDECGKALQPSPYRDDVYHTCDCRA